MTDYIRSRDITLEARSISRVRSSRLPSQIRLWNKGKNWIETVADVDHVVVRLRLGMGLGPYAALSGRRAIGASTVSLARDVNRHAASTAQSISESAIHVDGDIAVYRDDQLFFRACSSFPFSCKMFRDIRHLIRG